MCVWNTPLDVDEEPARPLTIHDGSVVFQVPPGNTGSCNLESQSRESDWSMIRFLQDGSKESFEVSATT